MTLILSSSKTTTTNKQTSLSGEWKPASYVAVTTFAILVLTITIGTADDIFYRVRGVFIKNIVIVILIINTLKTNTCEYIHLSYIMICLYPVWGSQEEGGTKSDSDRILPSSKLWVCCLHKKGEDFHPIQIYVNILFHRWVQTELIVLRGSEQFLWPG